MPTDGPDLLRELADDLEHQQQIFNQVMLFLRNLTGSLAPWEHELMWHPTFRKELCAAQRFVREFDESYKCVNENTSKT